MCRWGESFSETASQGKGESRRRRFCDDVSEERERRGERRWSVKRHVYKTNYPVIILSRPEPYDNWELNFSQSSYILIYSASTIGQSLVIPVTSNTRGSSYFRDIDCQVVSTIR